MSDYDALINAIHSAPDEDMPRLMLADWLLEHGDESQQAKGELIQIQCLMPHTYKSFDRDESYSQVPNPEYVELERRESAILKQYADTWRKGPVCEKCGGSGKSNRTDSLGFTVRCHSCYGTGDAGGLTQSIPITEGYSSKAKSWSYKHKVEYHRGMKRVYATLEECVQEDEVNCSCLVRGKGAKSDCEICHGRGKVYTGKVPSDWLLSVIQHHPDVMEVCVTDAVPSNPHYNPTEVGWLRTTDTRHGVRQTPVEPNKHRSEADVWADLLADGVIPFEEPEDRYDGCSFC